MIASIKGVVVRTTDKYAVVDVAGVGYKVWVTIETALSLQEGKEAMLHTYLAVRENALDLFGFRTLVEHDLFEKLLSVSGIGPKSAIAILSLASVDTLRKAISGGDLAYLTKVSGIGKKTAEKIIVELKDKLGGESESGDLSGDLDALEALKSLGYAHHEAREALQSVPISIVGTNNRIKEALRFLGK